MSKTPQLQLATIWKKKVAVLLGASRACLHVLVRGALSGLELVL